MREIYEVPLDGKISKLLKDKKGQVVKYSEITQEYYEEKGYKRLYIIEKKNTKNVLH